jgi:hypothetical protein
VVRRKLGDDLNVVLREVTEIERTPRGKGKWLVSTLPTPCLPETLTEADIVTAEHFDGPV